MNRGACILVALLIAALAGLAAADGPPGAAQPPNWDPSAGPPPPPFDPSPRPKPAPPAKIEPPAAAIDAAKVDELAAQLGSDEYAVREAAEAKLAELGSGVMAGLDRTLARSDDVEVLTRLERVYRKLTPQETYAGKSPRPGFLGVQMEVVSTDQEPRLKGREWGVRVTGVVSAGPAEKTGLRVADLVVRVDGEPFVGDVTTLSFVRRVQRAGDGGRVEIEFLRGSERHKVTVTLAGVPGAADVRNAAPAQQGVVIINGRATLSGPGDQVTEQDVINYRWSCWWQARRQTARAGAAGEQGGTSETPPAVPAEPAKVVPDQPFQSDPKEKS